LPKEPLLVSWPEVHCLDYNGRRSGTRATKTTKPTKRFVILVIFVGLVRCGRRVWYDAGMRRLLAVAILLLLAPTAAFADVTAFLGRTTTPTGRNARGLAIGTGLLIVGFEFEYSHTDEDLDVLPGPDNVAPEIRTYMFNGLLQTPVPIARMQFYGTIGGGAYQEKLSNGPTDDITNFASNIGGGAKISVIGPLRVRVDYRIFSLRGTPRHPNAQRLYIGANFKF
jgi:opacity protein-like surface antigen